MKRPSSFEPFPHRLNHIMLLIIVQLRINGKCQQLKASPFRFRKTWLLRQAVPFVKGHPTIEGELTLTFNLKNTTKFELGERRIERQSFRIRFYPKEKWFSQIVQIDATTGIYDYVLGKVRLAPGKNSYVIHGLDFDKATPVSSPPVLDELPDRLTDEIDSTFVLFKNLKMPEGQFSKMESLEKTLQQRIGSVH